jgi:predicted protein tyrosine phosphatase
MKFKVGDRVVDIGVVENRPQRNPRAVVTKVKRLIFLDFDDEYKGMDRALNDNDLILEAIYDSPLYKALS